MCASVLCVQVFSFCAFIMFGKFAISCIGYVIGVLFFLLWFVTQFCWWLILVWCFMMLCVFLWLCVCLFGLFYCVWCSTLFCICVVLFFDVYVFIDLQTMFIDLFMSFVFLHFVFVLCLNVAAKLKTSGVDTLNVL